MALDHQDADGDEFVFVEALEGIGEIEQAIDAEAAVFAGNAYVAEMDVAVHEARAADDRKQREVFVDKARQAFEPFGIAAFGTLEFERGVGFVTNEGGPIEVHPIGL